MQSLELSVSVPDGSRHMVTESRHSLQHAVQPAQQRCVQTIAPSHTGVHASRRPQPLAMEPLTAVVVWSKWNRTLNSAAPSTGNALLKALCTLRGVQRPGAWCQKQTNIHMLTYMWLQHAVIIDDRSLNESCGLGTCLRV